MYVCVYYGVENRWLCNRPYPQKEISQDHRYSKIVIVCDVPK